MTSSLFGIFTLNLSTAASFTKELGYNGTWHFALGGQYRFAEYWLQWVGAAYDTSPVDDADKRMPDLPLYRQIRIGTGIQYDWNEDMTVGVVYVYLDAGEADIDQVGKPLQDPSKVNTTLTRSTS